MTDTLPLLIVAPTERLAELWAQTHGLHRRSWRAITSRSAMRAQYNRDMVLICPPGWTLHPELAEYVNWLRVNRPDMRLLDEAQEHLLAPYRVAP